MWSTNPNGWSTPRLSRVIWGFALGLLILPALAATQDPVGDPPTETATPAAPQTEAPSSGEYDPDCPDCRQGTCTKHSPAGQLGTERRGQGHEHHRGERCGWEEMGKGPRRPEMDTAHLLLNNYRKIQRSIEDIPGGVRTRTTTDDPELVPVLHRHVQEMVDLMASGDRVRVWDPLFDELFDHADAIQLEVRTLENGVEVVETSQQETVVPLIRAHARKVDDFIQRGPQACAEATPLPELPSEGGR